MAEGENVDSAVRHELQARFAAVDAGSLVATCEQLEATLIDVIRRYLIRELASIAKASATHFAGDDEYFVFDDRNYRVLAVEHPSRRNVLAITVRAVERGGRLIRRPLEVQLDSLGRYVKLSVRFDSGLARHQYGVAEVLKAVVESAYRWLTEYVRLALEQLSNDTAEDLYSHLWQVLPPRLAENIWLCAIAEDHGLYIPNRLSRDRALAKAAQRSCDTRESPLELVAEFTTEMTRFDEMFAKEVLRTGLPTPVNLPRAKYSWSGFQVAEEAIYQTEQIVTHPLVREGNTLMVAGYPAGLRQDIEALMEREKPTLKEILERRATTLRSLIRDINRRGILSRIPSELSAHAGAFAGEFTKRVFGTGP